MKKFLLKSLFFVLVILAILFVINVLQSHYNLEPQHYKLQYDEIVNKISNANGIILGSSHATHSIRPTILDKTGIRFYNFSLNGSNPTFYIHWFNELFIKKYQKPKYCIITVDWFMFDTNLVHRHFEQDSEHFPHDVFINTFFRIDAFNKTDLLTNRFPVIKYRKGILSLFILGKGNRAFSVEDYDRGFIPYQIHFDSVNFKPSPKININQSQLTDFKILLNQIESMGIDIIFVMIPEYGIEKKKYEQMESIKILNNISQEYNIPFLNFNTDLRSSLNENIHSFSDWGHLNKKGSLEFSNNLANEISKIIKARTHNNVNKK